MRLRQDGVTWQEIDGELVILDLDASQYLTTNGSGAFVAQFLRDERSLDEISEALADEYGIDSDRAQEDAAAFVADLRGRGLLVED